MNATPPAEVLAQFRAAVMADPATQQLLAAQYDPTLFEAHALAFARRHGIALSAADLDLDQSRDLPGFHRVAAAPQSALDWPPPPWLPIRLVRDGVPAIDWNHFAGCKPIEPFFDESVRAAATRPFNRLIRYRTALDAFLSSAEEAMPRGLIFHMSRCGSTLAAQMLGAASDIVALSEPEPFDELLQLPLLPEHRPAMIRAMAAALGRGHPHFVLKTDAWHTLAMPLLLREAFPGVPWVFLYRDPIEVLVSHARMPGRHVAPGGVPALDAVAPDSFGLDYAARILAHICRAVIEFGVEHGGMLVHYRERPEALFSRILPHFGLDPSAEDRARMAQAAQQDAKAPHAAFAPDGAAKRREADAAAHAALHHLEPVYAQLEAIRAASLPAVS